MPRVRIIENDGHAAAVGPQPTALAPNEYDVQLADGQHKFVKARDTNIARNLASKLTGQRWLKADLVPGGVRIT